MTVKVVGVADTLARRAAAFHRFYLDFTHGCLISPDWTIVSSDTRRWVTSMMIDCTLQ